MIFRLFNPSVHSTLYQSPFWGQLPRHLCRDGGGLGPWASPGFRGPSGTRTQSRPLTRQEDDMQQLLAESVLFKAAGSGVSRLGSRAPCETGVFFLFLFFIIFDDYGVYAAYPLQVWKVQVLWAQPAGQRRLAAGGLQATLAIPQWLNQRCVYVCSYLICI